MTKVSIDRSSTRHGAAPFLLVWSLANPAETLRPAAVQAALNKACSTVAAGESPDAQAAIEAYKAMLQAFGRNPNRYRISSDALTRRCQRDGQLPAILPLVDLNNAISLRTGWPIGCYDAGRIEGEILLRVGATGETMPTLGKGEMDIAGLPVLCDDVGPFGSTISDSVRTSVTEATQLAVFIMYGVGPANEAGLAGLVERVCGPAGGAMSYQPFMVRG